MNSILPFLVAAGCFACTLARAADPGSGAGGKAALPMPTRGDARWAPKFFEYKVQAGTGWNEAVAAYATALKGADKNFAADIYQRIQEGVPICKITTVEDPELLGPPVSAVSKKFHPRFEKLLPGDVIYFYAGDEKQESQPEYAQLLVTCLREGTPETRKLLEMAFGWKSTAIRDSVKNNRIKTNDAALKGRPLPTIGFEEARAKLKTLVQELIGEWGEPGLISVAMGDKYSASTLIRQSLPLSTAPGSPQAAEIEAAMIDFYSAYNEEDVSRLKPGDRMKAFFERSFAKMDSELAQSAEARARFIARSKVLRVALDDFRVLRAAKS